MIKVIDPKKEYSFLKKFLNKTTSALIICLHKKSKPEQIIISIKKYSKNNPKGQILIISKIKFLKSKASTIRNRNIETMEQLPTIFAKSGEKINLIRTADFFETSKFLNGAISKIKEGREAGKTEILYKEDKIYHYLISKKDFVEAVKKTLETNVNAKIFNISLNKILERDLIQKLLEIFSFTPKEIKLIREETNEKIYSTETNRLIGFKPEYTIREYLQISKKISVKKEKAVYIKQIDILPTKSSPRFLKIGINQLVTTTKYLLFSTILIGSFLAFEFILDNYYLYKNISTNNISTTIEYANKLRNRNLPTKYGENYNYIYNTLFYGLNAVELAKNSLKEETFSKTTIESITEMGTKSLAFAKNIDAEYFLTPIEKTTYQKYKTFFNLDSDTAKYARLLELYALFKDEQNVLVLIQNSNELRPSGGVIGSYAIFTVKNLKIQSYNFDDIYNIDGTLDSKYPDLLYEAPSKYKETLNIDYIHARDLNLILDHKQRDELAIKYFEKALNTKIDSIVYLNLDAMKRILAITGPIYLGTYGVQVNSENFDTLAQSESEKSYYSGSTQKKNFLSTLGARVIEELNKEEKNSLNLELAGSIIEGLQSKEVLFYLNIPRYQTLIEDIGLANEIKNTNNKYEYLYIIENNLGENKTSKKVQKNVNYNVYYDQRRGLKSVDAQVEMVNQSITYNWPYGDYKGLLQVFLPNNINLTSAKVKSLDTNLELNILRNVGIENFNNLTLVNLPFTVKPTEKIVISFSYEKEDPEFTERNYVLTVQKQPGSKAYDLNITIDIPDIKKVEETITVNRDLKI